MINNVTINGLLPGPFETDRLRGTAKAEAEKRGITPEQLLAERAKLNPAGRFGDPDEFGYACAFLCGAKAGFITGQNILLDGGAFPGTLVKAVWYERTGPAADVLTFGEMPTPVAGPGEVRIRLEASGVNPADVGRRGGSYRAMEYPRVIPNSDGAGIIDQVGDGVARLASRAAGLAVQRPAQRPRLRHRGGIYRACRASGDAVAGPAVVRGRRHAWHSLHDRVVLPVRRRADRGQTVLVTGGAGAVGHYAVQLAKWGGAQVIATVSSSMKAEQARLAGADLVINYRTEDVVAKAMAFTERRGVDRVVDVDFGGNIATTLKLMAMNSTIAVYATNGNRTPVVPMRELMEKCIALRTLVLFALPQHCLAAAQADITKWLAAGRRIHNIAGQFPLSETAQAHMAVEKGDKIGTVIVDCAR